MAVLVYTCTKDADPHWHFVQDHPRGIAYETDTHFVHFSSRSNGVFTTSTGLTITERKSGTLGDWIVARFAAQDIQETYYLPGQVRDKVWRPGLYYTREIAASLGVTIPTIRQAERSLVSLIRRLNEILNYIEPSEHGLLASGHRTRELLILACTDVEDQWIRLLRGTGMTSTRLTTNDYVRLKAPLHLQEFRIAMPGYPSVTPVNPFATWSSSNPTTSLDWYHAYNKAKHDKTNHLADATLRACIDAVAANIALFSAQYGPHTLYENQGSIGSIFNEMFSVELSNPDTRSFYAPIIDTAELANHLQCFESKPRLLARTSVPLIT